MEKGVRSLRVEYIRIGTPKANVTRSCHRPLFVLVIFGSTKREPNPSPYVRPFAAIAVVVDVPVVADEKATLGFVGWGALKVQKTGENAAEADAQVVAASAEVKLEESDVEQEEEEEKEEEMEQDEEEEGGEEEGEGATAEADVEGGEAPLL